MFAFTLPQMSLFTRRRFLHTGSLAIAAANVPLHRVRAATPKGPPPDVPEIKALADAALDAAHAAGAIYAEVHVRVAQRESWDRVFRLQLIDSPGCALHVAFGVRALVQGYWGYEGYDGVATRDVAVRMGRAAVMQAKTAATGKARTVELASTPVVTGTWTMPVAIDPFTVSYEEKYDTLAAMNDFAMRMRGVLDSQAVLEHSTNLITDIDFSKEERTFVSSSGSFVTQTNYCTACDFRIRVDSDWRTELSVGRSTGLLSMAGAGWEYVRDAGYRDRVQQMIEEALRARRPKPVDVGRYDIVFDAQATAGILNRTIGDGTAIDRAMGTAVSGNTSFLSDPLAMLGTFEVGSPLLTVSANRSMPGGAATVKWDDEGVEPPPTMLVHEGRLTDYQTTRESASWLASYYQRAGMPVRSNGCAEALGSRPPGMRTPNLVMQPGSQELSFDELVKDTQRGLAVLGGSTHTDFQALNGYGQGALVYEINNGKLGASVAGALYQYRTPEFWRSLVALGGPQSAHPFGFSTWSEDDIWRFTDRVAHTVSAVPMKVTGVAVVDPLRHA
jgi:TldD protein